MTDTEKGIIAVIPAYNEGLVIGSIVLDAAQYVDHVIVADDGSTDQTAAIAAKAGAEVIRFPVNRGKAAAMMTALSRAREIGSPVTVMLDGDGQHSPRDIPAVAGPVFCGCADLVVGSRFLTETVPEEIPVYRRFGQKILNKATNISSASTCSDSQSGYRGLSRRALENLDFASSGYGFESDMLVHFADRGLKIVEVPISVTYDVPHKHKMNPVLHGLSVLTRVVELFSMKKPLVCLGLPGIFFIFCGIYASVLAIIGYYTTMNFPFMLTLCGIFSAAMGFVLLAGGLILSTLAVARKEMGFQY